MEITYIGHSCFKIKGQNLTLVTDPFDGSIGYKVPKLKADVLLMSHDHFDHANKDAVSDYKLLIDGPGEYEASGVTIIGLPTFHDDSLGVDRGKNTIYAITIDNFTILHLGDLGHELSKETLERLPEIDVLMVPIGGIYTIDAKTAVKVISSIEPSYVIPMHYQTAELKLGESLDTLEKFMDEMGLETHKTLDMLKLSKRGDVSEETEVVVLKHTA